MGPPHAPPRTRGSYTSSYTSSYTRAHVAMTVRPVAAPRRAQAPATCCSDRVVVYSASSKCHACPQDGRKMLTVPAPRGPASRWSGRPITWRGRRWGVWGATPQQVGGTQTET